MDEFAGKTVLVTGASAGIGLGIARAFAQAGAAVALAARTEAPVRGAAAQMREAGGIAEGFSCDVGDAASVAALIAAVQEWRGGLDVLCCNAGIFPGAPLATMTVAQWDAVQATNARGTFLCVQAAMPLLARSAHGRVILTSSITGPVTGLPGWSHYGASKAAQLGFMRSAAIELARDGVTINAVLPGNILTEGLRALGDAYLAGMAAAVPMGRLGTVEDVAHAVLYFALPSAGYVTGQSLIVDGGQILPESLEALTTFMGQDSPA